FQRTDLFRAGVLERTRPDSEGATIWPNRSAGEPWGRCKGTLLVHRCHAFAQLSFDVLPVSSIALSLRGAGRSRRQPLADGAGVRAMEHRGASRKPVFRYSDRICESFTPRHFDQTNRNECRTRHRTAPFVT